MGVGCERSHPTRREHFARNHSRATTEAARCPAITSDGGCPPHHTEITKKNTADRGGASERCSVTLSAWARRVSFFSVSLVA